MWRKRFTFFGLIFLSVCLVLGIGVYFFVFPGLISFKKITISTQLKGIDLKVVDYKAMLGIFTKMKYEDVDLLVYNGDKNEFIVIKPKDKKIKIVLGGGPYHIKTTTKDGKVLYSSEMRYYDKSKEIRFFISLSNEIFNQTDFRDNYLSKVIVSDFYKWENRSASANMKIMTPEQIDLIGEVESHPFVKLINK